MDSGLIFDIKRYAINDGPGIRVTVFFKGCPLRCVWCHNPESVSKRPQKLYTPEKCIGCKSCISVCPEQACSLTQKGIVTDMARCTGCGRCAEICPTKAIEISGKLTTASEIVEVVEKERIFFEESGGGVTFSGGEPLLQPRFLTTLLQELGQRGIHRAVDTTGFVKTETLLEIAKNTDLFLYDLKMMDSSAHQKWTGVANTKILDNLKKLAATEAAITIRIPLIHGVNAAEDNIEQTAAFVASLPGPEKQVNLLPYHDIATNKYRRLGKSYSSEGMAEPDSMSIKKITAIFHHHGINATVGG